MELKYNMYLRQKTSDKRIIYLNLNKKKILNEISEALEDNLSIKINRVNDGS